jgi:hypothetical protein
MESESKVNQAKDSKLKKSFKSKLFAGRILDPWKELSCLCELADYFPKGKNSGGNGRLGGRL